MLAVFQITIFLMGITSVCFSIYFIRFFRQSKRPLSFAMQAFLFEQLISAVATLIFASNSLLRTFGGQDAMLWNSIHPAIAIGLRAAMFGAMIFSTIRLGLEIARIQQEKEGDS